MSAFEPHELLGPEAPQTNNRRSVVIQGIELPIIEYRGVRVVTLSMIDAVHKRPENTARRSFNEHRERFIEVEDFFQTTPSELREHIVRSTSEIPINKFVPIQGRGVTLLTESGYMMLVKPLNDDLAWDVQRQLVKSYFAKPAPLPVRQPRRAVGSNKSLDSFRQARALDIITGVADRICAKFPDLGAPAQQGIYAALVNGVVGESIIPLPKIEQLYNATEVGAKFGVNKSVIGRLAVAHGVKVDRYGEWLLDKSQSSEKQVQNFHYNAAGVARIGELLGHGSTPVPSKQAQLGFEQPEDEG